MKVLAFGASSSRNSINKKLANYSCSLLQDSECNLIDLNDFQMPIYSEDIEKENGFPEKANHFIELIRKSDAIVISLAEHNGSYTAAFKNLIDWCSRVKRNFLQDKPIILLSTSPGPGGGASVLSLAKNSMKFFSGRVIGDLSVPSFYENFDTETNIISNNEIKQKIQSTINLLK